MPFRIDVYFHWDPHSTSVLGTILEKVNHIMADLTELQAAVARVTDVENSAITLLQGLKAQLDAALTDPVALKALSDQLGADTAALAAAISANTPTTP